MKQEKELLKEIERNKKKEAKQKQKEQKQKEQSLPSNPSPDKLEEMYHMVMDYENKIHLQNQRRIKIGLRCICIIPAIFMFLMFMTGSSKVIFLVLWIVSLFGIAVYLIGVEYVDYNLQQKMNEINGEEHAEPESLIEIPGQMEERMVHVAEILDRGGEA